MQHGLTPLCYTGYTCCNFSASSARLSGADAGTSGLKALCASKIAFQQCASDEKRTFLLIKGANGLCLLIIASGALCARPHLFFSLTRPSRRNVICYLDNVIFCLKK